MSTLLDQVMKMREDESLKWYREQVDVENCTLNEFGKYYAYDDCDEIYEEQFDEMKKNCDAIIRYDRFLSLIPGVIVNLPADELTVDSRTYEFIKKNNLYPWRKWKM